MFYTNFTDVSQILFNVLAIDMIRTNRDLYMLTQNMRFTQLALGLVRQQWFRVSRCVLDQVVLVKQVTSPNTLPAQILVPYH
jgi:hypothetical protein